MTLEEFEAMLFRLRQFEENDAADLLIRAKSARAEGYAEGLAENAERVKELEAEIAETIAECNATCNSYAEENQRFHDQILTLTAERDGLIKDRADQVRRKRETHAILTERVRELEAVTNKRDRYYLRKSHRDQHEGIEALKARIKELETELECYHSEKPGEER